MGQVRVKKVFIVGKPEKYLNEEIEKIEEEGGEVLNVFPFAEGLGNTKHGIILYRKND